MGNNADWSRRQTMWLLLFRRLPHQSLNRQYGKMQTSSAENAGNDARIHFLTMNAIYNI